MRAWRSLLDELSPDQIQKSVAAAEDFAFEVMHVVPRFAVLHRENGTTADAASLDAALAELEAVAVTKALPLLAAGARAARIVAYGEVLKDIDRARTLAAEGLAMYANDPDAEFLIRDAIGTQLAFVGDSAGALRELTAAVALPAKIAPMDRVHALLRVSLLLPTPESSVQAAQQALKYALFEVRLPRSERVRAYAVLALALEEKGDADAFGVWADGARELLAETGRDVTYQGMVALFGHALGYYMSMATSGRPPDVETGKPYERPTREYFLRDFSRAAPAYTKERRPVLGAQLEMYASARGDEIAATEWAEIATNLAEAEADSKTRALLCRTVLPFQLRSYALAAAIGFAADTATAFQIPGKSPETIARQLVLLSAYMRAATAYLQRAPLADSAAQELAGACRDRANATGDEAWKLVADVVDSSLIPSIRSPSLAVLLIEAGNSGDSALEGMARIATSLSVRARE